MRIVTKEELSIESDYFTYEIKEGAIFIHPTDTIYGLGCNARNSDAVKKIRDMKKRTNQPFSILVPGKDWILKNCEITPEVEKWIKKLPGPYTLIVKLKNRNAVTKEIAPGLDSVGVRIPNHWFSKFVEHAGFPIITTSANVTGSDFMTSIDDIDVQIKSKLDFVIYEGEKKGSPSTLVDLSQEKTKITRR